MRSLKVSEIAERAGVSIRTLHYYEELGLLEPGRTASGHRRYGRAAIERLQQIRSLQQLGFSLAQIQALFAGQRVAPEKIVDELLAKVAQQREALKRLETQLRRLSRLLRGKRSDDAEAVDVLLQTLEAMTMVEKHLSPEQLEQIDALHDDAGEAGAKWQFALDGLRAEMEAGTDPGHPKVKALVETWHEAAAAFMPAGDEAVHEAVMRLLHDEPEARREHGLDDALFAYLGRALAPDEHRDS